MHTELEVTKPAALTLAQQAQGIIVNSTESANAAAETARAVKQMMDAAEEKLRPTIKKQYEAYKSGLAVLNEIVDPLKAGYDLLRGKIAAWELAEKARIEREQREAEERLRREAEEAMERDLQQAEAAGASAAEIAAIIEVPQVVFVPPPPPRQATAGASARWQYGVRITNVKLLAAAVSDGRAPINAMSPNETVLNGMARAMKETFAMPGCELVKTPVGSIRR